MLSLLRFGTCALLGLTLLGCGKKDDAAPAEPATTSLTLATMQPAAGAVVSKSSTINATLNYTLADNETSEFGYRVAIQFQSTAFGVTFASGSSAVTLTDRKGTVSFSYPLASVWNQTSPVLQHPVTCYFYLQRLTSAGGQSYVIAKTPAQVFTE